MGVTNLDRRQFLRGGLAAAGLGLLSSCGLPRLPWQAKKVPQIGFLAAGSREARAHQVDGFRQGLREHGYVEDRDIAIEYRFSDTSDDQLPGMVAELLDLNVAVIVTSGAPSALAAARATKSTPIVLGAAADPVATGLVVSLARPGGNVTGMSFFSRQLVPKRLELLKEIIPGLLRVAVVWNPMNPSHRLVLEDLEAAARTLRIELQRLEVRTPDDFQVAFAAARAERSEALVVPADPLTVNRPRAIADLAAKHGLPAIYEGREFTEAGGLMSYGPNAVDLYRRSAGHVDKILKGANPADLPVEQPTQFDFIINKKTADALGLTIPPPVLAQATEMFE